MQSDRLETTILSNLFYKEEYARKVLPFLKEGIDTKFELLDTQSVCCLGIELNNRLKIVINDLFKQNETSFSNFTIPKYFDSCSSNEKIELVNGLLDSIGFANKGNWRSESELYRVYFQVVSRNIYLPVSLDNYLRNYPINFKKILNREIGKK